MEPSSTQIQPVLQSNQQITNINDNASSSKSCSVFTQNQHRGPILTFESSEEISSEPPKKKRKLSSKTPKSKLNFRASPSDNTNNKENHTKSPSLNETVNQVEQQRLSSTINFASRMTTPDSDSIIQSNQRSSQQSTTHHSLSVISQTSSRQSSISPGPNSNQSLRSFTAEQESAITSSQQQQRYSNNDEHSDINSCCDSELCSQNSETFTPSPNPFDQTISEHSSPVIDIQKEHIESVYEELAKVGDSNGKAILNKTLSNHQAFSENDKQKQLNSKQYISNIQHKAHLFESPLVKFSQQEEEEYPFLNNTTIGKFCKLISQQTANSPLSYSLSSCISLMATQARGTRIWVNADRYIQANTYQLTVGPPATGKTPVCEIFKTLFKSSLQTFLPYLCHCCKFFTEPLHKLLINQTSSYGAWLQCCEYCKGVIFVFTDEISGAIRTFQLDKEFAEAAGGLCTGYGGGSLSRNFIDEKYVANVKKPYWCINVVAQEGLAKSCFSKMIKQGGTQRFTLYVCKPTTLISNADRRVCSTNGLCDNQKVMFEDIQNHIGQRAMEYFLSNLMNTKDTHNVIFSDQCEIILTIYDFCIDEYGKQIMKYSRQPGFSSHITGLLQKSKDQLSKIATAMYFFNKFLNEEPVSNVDENYFKTKVIPKSKDHIPKHHEIKDINIILASIGVVLQSITQFCRIFGFSMIHLNIDVKKIIQNKIHQQVVTKYQQQYKLLKNALKKNKDKNINATLKHFEFKSFKDASKKKKKNKSKKRKHKKKFKEQRRTTPIDSDSDTQMNDENYRRNHNRHPTHSPSQSQGASEQLSQDSSDDSNEEEQIRNAIQEDYNAISVALTFPGSVYNITNIRNKPTLKSYYSMSANHYQFIKEKFNLDATTTHRDIRNYFITILEFLSKNDYGQIYHLNKKGAQYIYFKPPIAGLKRWVKKDQINEYDFEQEKLKYPQLEPLLQLLYRCDLSPYTYISCYEIPNVFISKNNVQAAPTYPTIESVQHKISLNTKLGKIQSASLTLTQSHQLNNALRVCPPFFEHICNNVQSLDENTRKSGSKMRQFYIDSLKINPSASELQILDESSTENNNTNNASQASFTNNNNKKKRKNEINHAVSYLDNQTSYSHNLTHLPILIHQQLQENKIGRYCLELLKKRQQIKEHYFKTFKSVNPNVIKKILDDSRPISTLKSEDNPHHLEINNQFKNIEYRTFVERYHKQYNTIVSDTAPMDVDETSTN